MDDEDASGGVELDGVRALGTQLSRVDGRVGTLADRAAAGTLLVLVVERGCSEAREAVRALAGAGGRVAVVCQGRIEAAWALVQATGAHDLDVWVEPAPHRVSEALAATTVPTLVLFDGLEPVAWQDGWDHEIAASLVDRAGGRLGSGAPDGPGCPSRLAHEPAELDALEAADAGLVAPAHPGT